MISVGVTLAASMLYAADTPAVWLDVPFAAQEKNGCGTACVVMLMRYWKERAGAALPEPDQTAIQKSLYSSEARGIFGRDMQRYLEASGFSAFMFRGEWDDLSLHLGKGRPLIVRLAERQQSPLHYVIVAGVDSNENKVLVNDPARRKLIKVDRRDFEKAWISAGSWTLLAVPRSSP